MGNFSRDTFDKLKHYVGVRLQQGVPLVDADWNEQEDIRRYELQAFLKWFVGNGVPEGNDGFRILPVTVRRTVNDFVIKGGDDKGAGRCLVEGWDVINEKHLRYIKQPLYENDDLAAKWDVERVQQLTTPTVEVEVDRKDTVYLDVWEREVDADEDDNLVNSAIDLETCVRRKREWVVRVAEGAPATELPTPSDGHVYYPLATLTRHMGKQAIESKDIRDLRRTGVNVTAMADEIEDARGIKGNLGNRLDESLTKGGQLRHNVVGNDQVMDGAVSIAKLSTTLVSGGATSVEGTEEGPGVSVIDIQYTDEHAFYLISVHLDEPRDSSSFVYLSFNWMRRVRLYYLPVGSLRGWQHLHQLVIENPNPDPITVSYKVYRLNET